MATLPGITQSENGGGLGLVQPSPGKTHVKVGIFTGLAVNVLKFFTDPVQLKSECGVGPAVDAGIYHLENGGGVVGMMRINGTTDGVAGSVTVARADGTASTGTFAVSGAPNDAYQVRVRITKEGATAAAATATFRYTIDGGDTESEEIALPGSGIYAIPGTGLTITSTDGAGTAFRVGDTHTFICTAPGYSSSELGDTLDKLRTDFGQLKFRWVHVVGQAADAAAAATIAALLATKALAELVNKRPIFFIQEMPDVSDANMIAAYANFVSNRVGCVAGFEELFANNRVMKRAAAWPVCLRLAQQSIHRSPARTRSDSEGGALPGVVSLHRDEQKTPALTAARFITLRTHPGKSGFFITKGLTMGQPSDALSKIALRRVMDEALSVTYDTLFEFLEDNEIDVDEAGLIDEVSARSIETAVNAPVEAAIVNKRYITRSRVAVKRDVNIISTEKLVIRVGMVPRGYVSEIEETLSFENPAIAA